MVVLIPKPIEKRSCKRQWRGEESKYNIFVEDIMMSKIRYVSSHCTYKDLLNVLKTCSHKTLPLVESSDSMVLLGSIERSEIADLLDRVLSKERRIRMSSPPYKGQRTAGPEGNRDSFRYVDEEETGAEEEEKKEPIEECNGPIAPNSSGEVPTTPAEPGNTPHLHIGGPSLVLCPLFVNNELWWIPIIPMGSWSCPLRSIVKELDD
ncbi:unnamed protein product [Ranitomeya imitator]|uniref:CBS domain-containing protein n=1 Tax=Ranitomeya imitator TaxID=111125 RepID=A0ABN9MKM3_9NEOB|nr:unnamed protein product [Ranitomeya imitator]